MKKIYLFFSKYKILHIFYWIYASFEIWHNLRFTRNSSVFDIPDLINAVGCEMLCVYFVIYYLLPKYFYRKKFGSFLIGFMLALIFSSALNMAISWSYIKLISPERTFNMFNAFMQMLTHSVAYLQASVLFLIVILVEYYVKKEQQSQIVEKERIESELNFLKAQMNPHFLFNALNSIYFLIDGNRERSKEVLIKFSDLLRYQLYDCSVQKSALESEVNFLQDYIDLEKIRNNENLSVEFQKSGDFGQYMISPLLLIPFLENAFKYVSHEPGRSNFVNVFMSIDPYNWLDFSVENSFSPSSEKTSGGLGISNVKRRLELLYPGQHDLQIVENENVFEIRLKLKLK